MSHPPSFVYASVSKEMLALDEELQALGGGDTRLDRASLYHFIHPRSTSDEQTIWINDKDLEFRDVLQPKTAPKERSMRAFPHSGGAISLDPYVQTDTGNEVVEQICSRINEGFNVCMLNMGSEGSDKNLALWGIQSPHAAVNAQSTSEENFSTAKKLLGHTSFIHAILQNLYHYAAIHKATEMTRISVSMFCLHNADVVDLLTPYSVSSEPLEFCNIYCKDMQVAVDVLRQAYCRLPRSSCQVIVKILVHKSNMLSDQGGLSTLYIVDTVNLINLSKSASFRSLDEKSKALERAKQLEINCLLSMLQDMRRVSNNVPHSHSRTSAGIINQNYLVDSHMPPAKRLLQARNSRLTTILAPILQGNMSIYVCTYMTDALQNYYANKELLTHLYKVSDIVSACYKVKGICWTELSMMFPEQVLPVSSSKQPASSMPSHRYGPSHVPAVSFPDSPAGASVQTVHTDYGDIDLEAIVGGVLDNHGKVGNKAAGTSNINPSHFSDKLGAKEVRLSLEGHVPFSELIDISERAKGSIQAMAPAQPLPTTYLFNKPSTLYSGGGSGKVDAIKQFGNNSSGSSGQSVSKLMEEFHNLVKEIESPPPSSASSTLPNPNPIELYATLLYGEKPKFFIDHPAAPSINPPPLNMSSHQEIHPPPPPNLPLSRMYGGNNSKEKTREEDGEISLEQLCQPSPYTTSLLEKWEQQQQQQQQQERKTSGESRSKGGLLSSSYDWNDRQDKVDVDSLDDQARIAGAVEHQDGSNGSHAEEVCNQDQESADDSLDNVRRMNNLPPSTPTHTPSQTSITPNSATYSHDSIDRSSTPSHPGSPPDPIMPDYYMPVMQPTEPSATSTNNHATSSLSASHPMSYIPQYKDHVIPGDIRDLPTAMKVIEHLRRTQETLVQTLTNVTKEKEHVQAQHASIQQDLVELQTEREVYYEAHEYEKKTLYAKLQGAMQDTDFEGVFVYLQHECDRLQKENKLLQDENIKLELRVGNLDGSVSGTKHVDLSVEHYHKQIQDLSNRLKKGKVAYTQLQDAYEDLKNKERTFLIQ
eukprot:gene30069-36317_t